MQALGIGRKGSFTSSERESEEQAAKRKQDGSLSPISVKGYMDDLVDQFENTSNRPMSALRPDDRPMSSLRPDDGRSTSLSVCTHLEVPTGDTRPGTAATQDLDGRSTSLSVHFPDVPAGTGFSDAVLQAIQAAGVTPADSLRAAATSAGDDAVTVADVRGLEEMLGEVSSAAGSIRRDPQTPRGVTPGSFSDYGSEWTLPAATADELEEIRRINATTPGGADWRYLYGEMPSVGETGSVTLGRKPAWYEMKSRRRSRPHTSYTPTRAHHNTPTTEMMGKPQATVRPQTAGASPFSTKVLQYHFEKALDQYKGIPGTNDFIESLHKNDGVHFENNWQDRAIKRHLLLKLQRTLRAKSAQERRKVAEQETQIRQQGLHHHEECSVPGRGSHSDPGLHARLGTRSAPMRRDAWESSPGRHAPTSAPPPSVGSATTHRKRTSMTNRQASASYSQSSQRRRGLQSAQAQRRPHTAAGRFMATPAPTIGETRSDRVERQELSPEQPFRCRLSRRDSTPPPPQRPTDKPPEIDLNLLDPRNPEAQKMRIHTGKSIPDKCRYILVKNPQSGEQTIEVTPLEEQLIAERFPQFIDQWVGDQKRHGSVIPKHHSPVFLKHSVPPV